MSDQKWNKVGCIFDVSQDWGKLEGYSHCHKPTPLWMGNDVIRVYYGLRDSNNRTKVSFVDISAIDFSVLYVHKGIVLDLGELGTFDDVGAQVTSVVRIDTNTVYMYYIGWNTSTTVPARNALGLAVSTDNGYTFERMFQGPILERYKEEAFHVGASDIKKYDGCWKMWYNSGMGFTVVDGRPEYHVHIKYAESQNGIDWHRKNIVCIEPNSDTEVVVRPSVIYRKGKYAMFYSYRSIKDFRENKENSYRLGYAESCDGKTWKRMDEKYPLNVSSIETDWDGQMIAYLYDMEVGNKLVVFYNGNGFGRTGFGCATLSLEDVD